MLRHKFVSTVLVWASFIPIAGIGQTTVPNVYSAPKETIDRIRDEGMNRSQVMKTLSFLTDVIGPRLTGSPNLKRANEWTRDTMAKWGMQNAHLESWGPFVRGWSLRKFTASIVQPQYIPVIAYPAAWSPSTKGMITSDVFYSMQKPPTISPSIKDSFRARSYWFPRRGH